MLTYPNPDPVAIHLGPVNIYWYGLMYATAFMGAWWLGVRRANRRGSPLNPAQVGDLVTWAGVGVIAGGRLGYMIIYQWPLLLHDPLSLLKVWEGGMSFHGGLLGVLAALWLYGRRLGLSCLAVTDFVAPLVPLGLGAGRFGNFINGELWGKPTDLPWGMIGTGLGSRPHHPSMLYELLLEGLVLFLVMLWFTRRPRGRGAASGLFLTGYAAFRILVEFVRLPDPQIGYLAFGWLTMGQVLSLPMLLGGLVLLVYPTRHTIFESSVSIPDSLITENEEHGNENAIS